MKMRGKVFLTALCAGMMLAGASAMPVTAFAGTAGTATVAESTDSDAVQIEAGKDFTLTFDESNTTYEMKFTPDKDGRYIFFAPSGQSITTNNNIYNSKKRVQPLRYYFYDTKKPSYYVDLNGGEEYTFKFQKTSAAGEKNSITYRLVEQKKPVSVNLSISKKFLKNGFTEEGSYAWPYISVDVKYEDDSSCKIDFGESAKCVDGYGNGIILHDWYNIEPEGWFDCGEFEGLVGTSGTNEKLSVVWNCDYADDVELGSCPVEFASIDDYDYTILNEGKTNVIGNEYCKFVMPHPGYASISVDGQGEGMSPEFYYDYEDGVVSSYNSDSRLRAGHTYYAYINKNCGDNFAVVDNPVVNLEFSYPEEISLGQKTVNIEERNIRSLTFVPEEDGYYMFSMNTKQADTEKNCVLYSDTDQELAKAALLDEWDGSTPVIMKKYLEKGKKYIVDMWLDWGAVDDCTLTISIAPNIYDKLTPIKVNQKVKISYDETEWRHNLERVFVPEETGMYKVSVKAKALTYGYIKDMAEESIVQGDDNNSFEMMCELKKGQYYKLQFIVENQNIAGSIETMIEKCDAPEGKVTNVKVLGFDAPIYNIYLDDETGYLEYMSKFLNYELTYENGVVRTIDADRVGKVDGVDVKLSMNGDKGLVAQVTVGDMSDEMEIPFTPLSKAESYTGAEKLLTHAGQYVFRYVAGEDGYIGDLCMFSHEGDNLPERIRICEDGNPNFEFKENNTVLQKGKIYYICFYPESRNCKASYEYTPVLKKATCSEDGYTTVSKTDSDGWYYLEKKPIAQINTVTLSCKAYTYDTKAKKPSVTVKDTDGKVIAASNYTVTYTNNTNVGIATAKITFKGNYAGTVTRKFAIKKFAAPATPKITKLATVATGTTVTWSLSANAGSYEVYRSVNGRRYAKAGVVSAKITAKQKTARYVDTKAKTNGVKYTYKVIAVRTLGNVTVKSAASAGVTSYYMAVPSGIKMANTAKRTVRIVYAANTRATGYQIRYSFKSNMSGAKVIKMAGGRSTAKNITGLTKGRRYYVSVRSYKTVGKKTYYSVWSTPKGVTVNK